MCVAGPGLGILPDYGGNTCGSDRMSGTSDEVGIHILFEAVQHYPHGLMLS